MATDIFDDFDTESQNQLQGLKMIDFEEAMGNRQNSSFQSIIGNKGFEERSNEFSENSFFGTGSVFYNQKGIKASIGEIENDNSGKWIYAIKTSSEGTDLIDEYKKYDSVLAESEGKFDKKIDFIIYLETDYNVSFGDILLIKMSNAMLEAYFDSLIEKPDPELLKKWSKSIYEQNRNTSGFRASVEDMAEAFAIEVEYRTMKNSGAIKYTPSEFLSAATDKLSEKIRELKIERENWDPTLKSENYKAAVFEKAVNYLVVSIENTRTEISDFRKKLEIMNRIAGFFSDRPGFIDKMVQFLQFIDKTIAKIIAFLKKLKNKGKLYFAFICGIVDGIIEFICGLIDVVFLIVKVITYRDLNQGTEIELDILKIREGLEEFIEAYINNPDLIDKKISEMAEAYSYARYDDKSLTEYQVAHNTGEDLVIMIDIILSFIAIVKGITKSSQYLPKFARWIDDVVERNPRIANRLEGQEELLRRVENLVDDLGGRLYTEKELKLLKVKLLEEYGVELRLIDKEVAYQKLPVNRNGKKEWIRSKELLKDWDRRGVVGKFDEGPPPIMILRSDNASNLTVFHEKVHMKVWYNKMPKMHIVDEEKYVFEAIFKTKDIHKWTDAELIDAYDYVNWIIKEYNKIGKNFKLVNNEFIEQLKWKQQFNF